VPVRLVVGGEVVVPVRLVGVFAVVGVLADAGIAGPDEIGAAVAAPVDVTVTVTASVPPEEQETRMQEASDNTDRPKAKRARCMDFRRVDAPGVVLAI
jgi:hypothetical protein